MLEPIPMELNHISFVMRGLDPRIQLFAKKMGSRIKPGDDDRDSIRVRTAVGPFGVLLKRGTEDYDACLKQSDFRSHGRMIRSVCGKRSRVGERR